MRLAHQVAGKDNIRVAFMLYDISFWKNEALFNRMMENSRFTPCFWIIPPLAQNGQEDANLRYEACIKYAKEKNYLFYTTGRNDWSVFKKTFAPDYLFLVHPYDYQIPLKIEELGMVLPCITQYGYNNTDTPHMYNNRKQQLFHRFYVESVQIAELAKKYMLNKASNVRVTGLPMADGLLTPRSENAWKNARNNVKKIIYAPHWSISNPGRENIVLDLSTFLELGEAILSLAEKYCHRIAFAFKPHPFLQAHLLLNPSWTQERIDRYYDAWNQLPNCQCVQGEYAALFQQSDAIIHDCGSFIHEYLLMDKPCMFLEKEYEAYNLNQTTCLALECYKKARTVEQIQDFIEKILNNEDEMKDRRKEFINSYLRPNATSPSQNIMEDILSPQP